MKHNLPKVVEIAKYMLTNCEADQGAHKHMTLMAILETLIELAEPDMFWDEDNLDNPVSNDPRNIADNYPLREIIPIKSGKTLPDKFVVWTTSDGNSFYVCNTREEAQKYLDEGVVKDFMTELDKIVNKEDKINE